MKLVSVLAVGCSAPEGSQGGAFDPVVDTGTEDSGDAQGATPSPCTCTAGYVAVPLPPQGWRGAEPACTCVPASGS